MGKCEYPGERVMFTKRVEELEAQLIDQKQQTAVANAGWLKENADLKARASDLQSKNATLYDALKEHTERADVTKERVEELATFLIVEAGWTRSIKHGVDACDVAIEMIKTMEAENASLRGWGGLKTQADRADAAEKRIAELEDMPACPRPDEPYAHCIYGPVNRKRIHEKYKNMQLRIAELEADLKDETLRADLAESTVAIQRKSLAVLGHGTAESDAEESVSLKALRASLKPGERLEKIIVPPGAPVRYDPERLVFQYQGRNGWKDVSHDN